MLITLDDMRRFAVARSLFPPTALKRALSKLGFVQADPIRAPARAQDLTLRHRVKNYKAGDLERRYAKLGVEEDFFVTYGFVPSSIRTLMDPRRRPWPDASRKQALLLLEFVLKRGEVHPREVDDHFCHGRVRNFWGGWSNATTQLLDAMHYRGLLRVARRESGIRIYTADEVTLGPTEAASRRARLDALVDVAVRLYAPLPAAGLSSLISRLRFAVPHWRGELKGALLRAKKRLGQTRLDGIDWYWPSEEDPALMLPPDRVRLLAPFDPVVWDRARFEILWGWAYRFEAYTPAPKRKLGYYALPLLWRDRVIGWANLSVKAGALRSEIGYVESPPRDRGFKRELQSELDHLKSFLDL
jgi:uncharacterized protein YcaQ